MGTSKGASIISFLMICCVVSAVRATLEDGLPRPMNFPVAPTESYGPSPELQSNGFAVECMWYGFANSLFDPANTTACLTVLRKALTNATVNPPSGMKPYLYYTIKRLIDPASNQSYCYQGCFNLGASLAPAPPPLDATAPPPVGSVAPTPSLFPAAPPPLDASSPPLGSEPPASILPPPTAMSPAEVPTSETPVAAPTTFLVPPTAPVVVPNAGAKFVQPTYFLSFLVAAFALIAL